MPDPRYYRNYIKKSAFLIGFSFGIVQKPYVFPKYILRNFNDIVSLDITYFERELALKKKVPEF